jgi:uroporphyrinogen decarboxylase
MNIRILPSTRQRVRNAIRHQPGAGIPTGELTMDRRFMEALLAWKGRRDLEKIGGVQMLIECSRLLGHDLVCLQSDPGDTDGPDLSTRLRDLSRVAGEGLFVFWVVDGAFQRTMHRHDFMAFMKAIAQRPDDVGREMERSSQAVTVLIEQGVNHGAHGIIIADDIAYQRSTYISPAFGRRYLLPLWRKQVAAVRAHDIPVFFHSDGNLNGFLPIIVEAGFDGLQCIEPAAGMDIVTIRRTYGTRLCLMGNIDPSLLCDPDNRVAGDEGCQKLDRTLTDLIAAVGGSGGLIVGSCCGLHAGMSPERVYHMYERVSQSKRA